nr:hypothetical protein [Tanacetum cinerariifolium]
RGVTTGFMDLNEEFAECFNNSSNEVNAVGSLVSAAGFDFTNSTNDFSAAGTSVSAVGLNFTNSTNDFSAAGPSNATMPNLEDLSYNADDVDKVYKVEKSLYGLHQAPRACTSDKENDKEFGGTWFAGTVIPRTDNKDIQNCLFAYF